MSDSYRPVEQIVVFKTKGGQVCQVCGDRSSIGLLIALLDDCDDLEHDTGLLLEVGAGPEGPFVMPDYTGGTEVAPYVDRAVVFETPDGLEN